MRVLQRSRPPPALLHLDRAARADRDAVALAHGRGRLELALGEILARLSDGGLLKQLSYARVKDYARERLRICGRLAFARMKLARELRERALLRRAVRAGALSPAKALAILPLAAGNDEVGWVGFALEHTLTEIERAVRGHGADPPSDDPSCKSFLFSMDAAQQDRLDAALDKARRAEGFALPEWVLVEGLCMEYLGGHTDHAPDRLGDPTERGDEDSCAAGEVRWKDPGEVERQIRALEEADDLLDGEIEGTQGNALALDALARRIADSLRSRDAALGVVLERVVRHRAWTAVGHCCRKEYVRERLGMSERTVRQRVWLERRLREPANRRLRAAFRGGRLSLQQTILLVRTAEAGDTPEEVGEETIARAERIPVLRLERESDEAARRRNRALGVRRLWGPREAWETLFDAIEAAQSVARTGKGERIDSGEALARIADHFLEVCRRHKGKSKWFGGTRVREHVLLRHGGLCAVPGCGNPAEHCHHLEYRSRQGSDEPWNLVGLCRAHHQAGLHTGCLRVFGRAGRMLLWWLGADEVYATENEDEVRRGTASERARVLAHPGVGRVRTRGKRGPAANGRRCEAVHA